MNPLQKDSYITSLRLLSIEADLSAELSNGS